MEEGGLAVANGDEDEDALADSHVPKAGWQPLPQYAAVSPTMCQTGVTIFIEIFTAVATL